MKTRIFPVVVVAVFASLALACRHEEPDVVTQKAPSWTFLASELPAALLSVSGRSRSDMFAVGADKGAGPFVLHFDGKKWEQLVTGTRGDLWRVHALAKGPVLMGGANATVLRYDGSHFERMNTPGLARQTVYGVWGSSGDDFYAVGSAKGRDGFIWHYHDKSFENEKLPLDLPLTAGGELPGFFDVWGTSDEVWVVGAAGSILHRKAGSPFSVVAGGTKETLFTVHGSGNHVLTVGGSSSGVLLEGAGSSFKSDSPTRSGLLQGAYSTTDRGDWASGERGAIFTRRGTTGTFGAVDHDLVMSPASSLPSIFVDDQGGVWAAGGNVLTPALDEGMLIHYGAPVPIVTLGEDTSDVDAGRPPIICPPEIVNAGKKGSIARRWDEQALAAIRLDSPRPTVHARNLFHVSAAMWDAWAGYDDKATGYFVREKHTASDVQKAREEALSYAAYDVLMHRYEHATGGPRTLACLRAVMTDLGYDANDKHNQGDDPVAFGNRIGHSIIESGKNDGANEASDYDDPTLPASANPPLVYDASGTTLANPAIWQPLDIAFAATQNGIVLPSGVQAYVGAGWGSVTPFAIKRASATAPFYDPGPTPKPTSPDMKKWLVDVIQKTASVDMTTGVTIDVSPGAYGHDTLGANDGHGWEKNPITGKPYPPHVVPLGDFARVVAELWADGPKSETPPGHWNAIANTVADSPAFERKLFGAGDALDPLSWDVHVYFALNAAEHDAVIAAWETKRREMTARPISLIRWMGGKGQSSDPKAPSYDRDGLPLVPGLIELVTAESSAPGQRHEHLARFVGQVAVRDWLGEPADHANQISGVGWVRAVDWIPFQPRSFVTPAYPAFVSGHSTCSRAAAETLTALTGSQFFPGGYGEYVAPKDTFLQLEKGPSVEVHLGWASYFDASDEAGQSRIYAGTNIQPDDLAGRRVGHQVGLAVTALAKKYFEGTAPSKPQN